MTSINSSLKNHKQLTIFHYLAEHFIIEVYICWPYVCHYTPAPPEGGYTVLPLSFRPCKIFFVAFFSATIDGKNLIFGHKLHIGMPYCGKRFWKCLIVNKYQYDNKQYAWKRYKTSFYHQNLEAKNIYMYKCIMFVILFESGYSCQLIWTSIKLYIVPCLSVYL
jgi:hypothetical protein